MTCQFIPSYIFDRLAEASDEYLAECGRRTASIDARLRARRMAAPPAAAAATGDAWTVHDAENGSTLPGRLVRTAGEPEVSDVTVNEAATGMTESLALFADFGRSSFDDKGATVVATVHYEQDYDNAFWDGTQLVFGDGDGQVFDRFTKPIDVLGHELSHAVTQFTANLTYEGQSGALNESMSDVFGACVKQRHLGQDAASADWLVGRGDLPARRQRPSLALDGGSRHGVRRPGDRQGPASGVDGRLREDDRGQRRRTHQQRDPQPRFRDCREGHRRRHLERRRADLVRHPHLRARRGQRLRHLRGCVGRRGR